MPVADESGRCAPCEDTGDCELPLDTIASALAFVVVFLAVLTLCLCAFRRRSCICARLGPPADVAPDSKLIAQAERGKLPSPSAAGVRGLLDDDDDAGAHSDGYANAGSGTSGAAGASGSRMEGTSLGATAASHKPVSQERDLVVGATLGAAKRDEAAPGAESVSCASVGGGNIDDNLAAGSAADRSLRSGEHFAKDSRPSSFTNFFPNSSSKGDVVTGAPLVVETAEHGVSSVSSRGSSVPVSAADPSLGSPLGGKNRRILCGGEVCTPQFSVGASASAAAFTSLVGGALPAEPSNDVGTSSRGAASDCKAVAEDDGFSGLVDILGASAPMHDDSGSSSQRNLDIHAGACDRSVDAAAAASAVVQEGAMSKAPTQFPVSAGRVDATNSSTSTPAMGSGAAKRPFHTTSVRASAAPLGSAGLQEDGSLCTGAHPTNSNYGSSVLESNTMASPNGVLPLVAAAVLAQSASKGVNGGRPPTANMTNSPPPQQVPPSAPVQPPRLSTSSTAGSSSGPLRGGRASVRSLAEAGRALGNAPATAGAAIAGYGTRAQRSPSQVPSVVDSRPANDVYTSRNPARHSSVEEALDW